MSAPLVAAIDKLTREVHALKVAAQAPERKAWRPSEVAQMTGLTAKRVRELIIDGELPAVRDGQRYYVPATALDEWLSRAGQVAS